MIEWVIKAGSFAGHRPKYENLRGYHGRTNSHFAPIHFMQMFSVNKPYTGDVGFCQASPRFDRQGPT